MVTTTTTSTAYLSDLSDAEWELVQPLFPPPATRGRPRRHSPRTILDAIFYLVRAGGAWRLLHTAICRRGKPSKWTDHK